MRVAVIDMGTNVYNLLLADVVPGGWNRVHEMKQPARLGDGGLRSGMLSERAFEAASDAMGRLSAQLAAWGGAERTYAVATSAVREAENGLDFADFIEEKYHIPIEVISGDREATLIYKGIREGVKLGKSPVLMLDIGGGSNEFIIADAEKMYWKHSFPLGMARLLEHFKPGDPVTSKEAKSVRAYLNQEMAALWQALEQYDVTTLIGSSGSFDTYRSLLTGAAKEKEPSYHIASNAFAELYHRLLHSTAAERMAMKGMTPVRVDFIVLAAILTNLVIEKAGITKIMQCSYSLKEGMMSELAESYCVY
jgi:exopolyphosphatase/guanosine-5'-triphosphate,3'-diphosphate pyrophosphatase